MLDIKQLLSKYRIEYKEHGPNCAKGHANVACPFCKNDPSYHLSINLNTGQYFCFRNPRHAGNILGFLLRKLGIPFEEYAGQKFVETDSKWVEEERDYSAAKYFEPAENSKKMLEYLAFRDFTNPTGVCKQFGLKYAPQGAWASRLIIPLTIGWTGRTIRNDLEPRYLAWTSSYGFFYYQHGSDSVIILEGSLDAMKVAATSSQFDVIAKCRMDISPAIFALLKYKSYQTVFAAPDGNVPILSKFQELKSIRTYCNEATVKQIEMPPGVKDFGELSESAVRTVLSAI